MSWTLQFVLAALIFAAGGAGGIKWQQGVQAQAELAASAARASDATKQIKVIDRASAAHVAALATINNKLGDQRAYIAKLSDRECFSTGTVSMLNSASGESVPAAASESASEARATAGGTGIRFATERDAVWAIASCRAKYAEVASQVNAILDIEEKRSP